MKRSIKVARATLFTGFTILLPLLVVFTLFNWVLAFIIKILSPFTNSFVNYTGVSIVTAHIIVITVFLSTCFLLGYYTRTTVGKEMYEKIELNFLIRIPGYRIIKETLKQFLGDKNTPFSSVALVRLYDNETLVTAFVTDEHENGTYTVFVPTGPNPTSGNIYHVDKTQLIKVNASVEDTMRSILGCGAGSYNVLKYNVKDVEVS